jgi:uncharacterized protein YoaH (UPF0181 family)
MTAYQNFLDFFSMHNKERLDGLNESYFNEMTAEEKEMAYKYLLNLVEKGGTEESVHGLFMAAPNRAVESIKKLMESGVLNGEAQIAAAWNLAQRSDDDNLIQVFIGFMNDPDVKLREKAAYYAPANKFSPKLKSCLQGMIRVETEQLARIHAVDKLLEIYGVTEQSLGEKDYLSIYRDLHNDDFKIKENAFKRLEKIFVQHTDLTT